VRIGRLADRAALAEAALHRLERRVKLVQTVLTFCLQVGSCGVAPGAAQFRQAFGADVGGRTLQRVGVGAKVLGVDGARVGSQPFAELLGFTLEFVEQFDHELLAAEPA
jgi:hypothetical protein